MHHRIIHLTLRHPLTGKPLEAVGVSRRGPIWPILGASTDPDPTPDPEPAPDPPADPKPDPDPDPDPDPEGLGDAGKKAIDRMKSERNDARQRAAKVEKELEELRRAQMNDQEKAIAEARDKAAAEARASVLPQLVSAEFRAAAAGRMSAEQVTELLEDLDVTKFVKDDGTVDGAKVAKKVEALAPPPDPKNPTPPTFGGGPRKTPDQSPKTLGEAIAKKLAGSTS